MDNFYSDDYLYREMDRQILKILLDLCLKDFENFNCNRSWLNLKKIKQSNQRKIKVLKLYFLNEKNMTYKDIGKEIGVGQERVRQIITTTLRYLRKYKKNLKYFLYLIND